MRRQCRLVYDALVSRRGRPVTKATLKAIVWPAGASDDSFHQCMRDLRRSLGDPRKVQFVNGGYAYNPKADAIWR